MSLSHPMPLNIAVEIHGAAADPTRLRLLVLLSETELTVSELTDILGQSQPRVSRHLRLLVDAGLVGRAAEGSWAFFRLTARGPLAAIARSIAEAVDRDDWTVRHDLARLADIRAQRAAAAQAYFETHAPEWDRLRRLHVADERVEAIIAARFGERPRATMLDLGTGTGRMLELLGPGTERAVGIDRSAAMLSVARVKLDRAGLRHCSVRQGDIAMLPYADGSIDFVVIHQVLHLLDDGADVVADAARVLAADGTLVIADFASHDAEFLRSEFAHRRLGFEPATITDWLVRAGLTNVEHQLVAADRRETISISIWSADRAAQRTNPSPTPTTASLQGTPP